MLCKLSRSSLVVAALFMAADIYTPAWASITTRPERVISIPGSPVKLALWDEIDTAGSARARFAVSLDGRAYSDAYESDNLVHLRYATFDPLDAAAEPMVKADLEGSATSRIFIVQFVTTPLDVFRAQIEAAGGVVHGYMPSNAYLCKLDAQSLTAVKSLPYVRWVGVYQPAYRLDHEVLDAHFGRPSRATGSPFGRDAVGPTATDAEFAAGASAVFNIQVFERGLAQKRIVADAVRAVGGTVQAMIPDGFVLQARLTRQQLIPILHLDEVLFVDPWGPGEATMDNVREVSGANFIRDTLGMTGQGVRAEVCDTGYEPFHVDLLPASRVLMHVSGPGNIYHGTATTGIVFGQGVGDPRALGLAPGAEQPIAAVFMHIVNRYTHTAELADPVGPYRAVFQTNSWGSRRSPNYSSVSYSMDDMLFLNDIVILNAQGNDGATFVSEEEAWAKNIVSVGGVKHFNTAAWDDDRWTTASRGPAADGRFKPDLASYYDAIWVPYTLAGPSGYGDFGGTSGATPITAGHFAIMFQMWHQGIFAGFGGGPSVFASRPHMTTAKALMINTARQWDMLVPGTNILRIHQGWGHADLRNLYNMRDKMLIVNETDVLAPLETKPYKINIAAGEPVLKATLTWADRPGATSASQHRVNLLTLKVISPDGTTFYWGNNGLSGNNMWSLAGGTPNTRDTVQNVFVPNPAPGLWTVEVRADALVQDGRVETPETDADFALVVTGGTAAPACRVDLTGDGVVDFGDYLEFLNLFDALDPRVDFNGDGVIDFGDYLEFLNLFDAGC